MKKFNNKLLILSLSVITGVWFFIKRKYKDGMDELGIK